MERQRVFGTPVYELDATNASWWRWVALPDSAAGPFEMVSGSEHQVGWHQADWSVGPSDPTIEQFKPIQYCVRLFMVESL